jgi:hypothetical protein
MFMKRLSGLGVSGFVVLGTAEQAVALLVAGRQQGVVHAVGRVLGQGQDRPAPVGDQAVPDLGSELKDGRPGVLHGHELAELGGVERPSVDDLLAVGVDHLDRLALGDPRGLAGARRDGDDVARH